MASRILLFLALFSLLAADGWSHSPDTAVMLGLKKCLISPSRLYWNDSDPCKWKNVRCSDNRVVRIQIGRQNLGGFLPSNINEITSLQVFEVQDNQIGGSLPSFAGLNSLQTLLLNNTKFSVISWDFFNGTTWLQTVNLEHNPFTSSVIPESLKGNVNIRMDYLPRGSTPGFDGSPTVAILRSFVAVLCAVIGVLVCFLCQAKVEPSSHVTIAGSSLDGETRWISIMGSSGPRELLLVEDDRLVFSIQVLKNATDNFNEQKILGRGRFGVVYKGELIDGTKIAVKKMKPGMMSGRGLDEFESEISARTKVRHINLVKFLGYCINGSHRLLVFELMTQGTLSRFLFNWNEEGLKPLEWRKRLGIALDVARSVEYMHCFAEQSFIIRDLKPANILLGDDMRAKVADFGFVWHVPPGEEASAPYKHIGTFGYIAPEYPEIGRVSTEIDVYSFGVVLMELITGRQALDFSLPKGEQHIVAWFRSLLISEGIDAFSKAIDPNLDLSEEEALSSIISVAKLAGYCSSREPNKRPCMSDVVYVLSFLAGVWKPTEHGDRINHCMTFAQMIKKWKVVEGMSSLDYTETILANRPFGFSNGR